VDGGRHRSAGPFGRRIDLWRAVPGGVDSDGNTVTEPPELRRAEFILGVCQRFGTLPWPGSLMEQPAEFLQLLAIEARGRPDAGDGY
jgi:hypothetical protein